jgi:hypothetical protein
MDTTVTTVMGLAAPVMNECMIDAKRGTYVWSYHKGIGNVTLMGEKAGEGSRSPPSDKRTIVDTPAREDVKEISESSHRVGNLPICSGSGIKRSLRRPQVKRGVGEGNGTRTLRVTRCRAVRSVFNMFCRGHDHAGEVKFKITQKPCAIEPTDCREANRTGMARIEGKNYTTTKLHVDVDEGGKNLCG